LNDASELRVFQEFTSASLTGKMREVLIASRSSPTVRKLLVKYGGVDWVAQGVVRDYIEAHYSTAFSTERHRVPLAEPFICSFCSHADDQDYERENGLLSQWRGYGTESGRFAIVFDTDGIDGLLRRAWPISYWTMLAFSVVIYSDNSDDPAILFKDFFDSAIDFLNGQLERNVDNSADLFKFFAEAASRIKHRAFREEREIRIVGVPTHINHLSTDGLARYRAGRGLRMKNARRLASAKRYVDLFEDIPGRNLPIRRVIVGPGANRADDLAFARSLIGNSFPVVASETPYVGR
jgi:hypothetical protein